MKRLGFAEGGGSAYARYCLVLMVWLAGSALACSTPVGGGSSADTGPTGGGTGDLPQEDTTTTPDTIVPGASVVAVFVGDEGLLMGDTVALPAVLPGPDVVLNIRLQIANLGDAPLTISQVTRLAQNADGSPANAYLELEYGTQSPEELFPVTLIPHAQDQDAFVDINLRYQPLGVDENRTTVVIESDNPEVGNRSIFFQPPSYAPKVRLSPDKGVYWYADLLNPEVKTFEIHNDGLGVLEVLDLSFNGKQSLFEFVEPLGVLMVPPKGAAGYAPATFSVSYQPAFGSNLDTVGVVITTNDPEAATVTLPLEAKYETGEAKSPCVWMIPGSEPEQLDFSDVETGSKTLTLSMTNFGNQVCTVTSVVALQDPQGVHYAISMEIPGDSEADPVVPPTPVEGLPVDVQSGSSLSVRVTYTATDAGLDTPLRIEYLDPSTQLLELNAIGPPNKPCFQWKPLPGGELDPLQFIGAPGSTVQRGFAIENCGEGTLTLEPFELKDETSAGEPSLFWAQTSPAKGVLKIEPGGLQSFTIGMALPAEEGGVLNGVLNIAWLGGEGPENLIVPLHSTSDSTLILPTAIAGEPDFVHVVNAGEPYLLDASASLPGAPEASIDSEGTLWYLLQRPAESQSGVKEEWASPTRLFIPDVPGLYVFELMVRTATEPVLLSPVTTVQINAVSE